MYEIKVILTFSGAHSLRNYQGKCEALHGHNWRIEVVAASAALNSAGMVMDFGELKKKTEEILEDLDHKHLNEVDYFKQKNPSSEEIARYIYDRLKETVASGGVSLEEVRVHETDSSCAVYGE